MGVTDAGRAIPPNPPQPVADWQAYIRDLEQRHRLNPRALEAETNQRRRASLVSRTYSKTSWQRVLNGQTLPPEWALRMLCAWKAEDDTQAVQLLRQANQALDSQRPADPAATDQPATPTTRRPDRTARRRAWLVAAGSAAAAATVAVAAMAYLNGPEPTGAQPTPPRATRHSSTTTYAGSTITLDLVHDGRGNLRAECRLTGGEHRRRIRGCNVMTEPSDKLTATALIRPEWPTWADAETAHAASTATPCTPGSRVWITVLFDLDGLAERITIDGDRRTASC